MEINLPKDLCQEAQTFVRDLIKELLRQDIVQELDRTLLELAASVYHVYFKSRKHVIEKGATYTAKGYGGGDDLIKLNPNFKIMQDSQIQLLKIIDQLGLSPRARKQLSSMPMSPLDDASPLKGFLARVEKRN